MVNKNRGFAPLIILIMFIWLAVAVGGAILVYKHIHHTKQYAAPADASKLPPRP